MKWKLLFRVWLFVTSWTIEFMEFSRQEYWSRQPFPSPGDLPNPVIEPRSPVLQADSLPAEPSGKCYMCYTHKHTHTRTHTHTIHTYNEYVILVSLHLSSFIQSCLPLCDPIDYSRPCFLVHHQLPEFTQTHVITSVMPSNHLILCRPLLLPSVFPSISVFSKESVLGIR